MAQVFFHLQGHPFEICLYFVLIVLNSTPYKITMSLLSRNDQFNKSIHIL